MRILKVFPASLFLNAQEILVWSKRTVSTGRDVATKSSSTSAQANDHTLTVCAISILAGILTNVLHEGLGHAATALVTGAKSGVLTTVAWSSDFDSRLVAAAGTLANLLAAFVFWIALRRARGRSVRLRFFLLTSLLSTPLLALDISSFPASPILAIGPWWLPACPRTGCGGHSSRWPE